MSCAKAAFSSSSTIALPPYLTTTVAPWKRCSHGSASTSTAAFSGLGRVADVVGHEEYALFSST